MLEVGKSVLMILSMTRNTVGSITRFIRRYLSTKADGQIRRQIMPSQNAPIKEQIRFGSMI